MVSHTIGTVLGPIVVGTNINFFLFGIVLYQFSTYLTSTSPGRPFGTSFPSRFTTPTTAYQRDPILTRALVWWLILLDTYSTAVCGYMQWQYTIDNSDDSGILQVATWPFSSTPIATILASVTVQCFLAWKIRNITRRNLYFVIIVVLSVVQGLAGLGTGIGALWVSDISRFYQLEPIAGVWFCAQVACDMVITTVLVLTLNRERTGFKHTDNVINRLIRGAVETALFASVFCLLDLVMFFSESGNNLHLAFALPMGRIYSNTILATLNARQTNRDILDDGLSQHGARRGAFGEYVLRRGSHDSEKTSGIKVSITHDVELSPCPVLSGPTTPPPTPPSSMPSESPKSEKTLVTSIACAPCTRSIVVLPSKPAYEEDEGGTSPVSNMSELEAEGEAALEKAGSVFTGSAYSLQDVDLSGSPFQRPMEECGHVEERDRVVFVGRRARRIRSAELMGARGRGRTMGLPDECV